MNVPVFLIFIISLSNTGSVQEKRYVMPNMETCLKSVQAAQLKIAGGGEAEGTLSLFCAEKAYK